MIMATAKKMAKAKRNWDPIEQEYLSGILSIREIGRVHGVSDRGIRKKAEQSGWVRRANITAADERVVLGSVEDEMDRSGFVYVIYLDSGVERFYKIGLSKVFSSRFNTHQCASPFDICVACCYFVGNMRKEESDLHRIFDGKRVRGEWFRLDGADLSLIASRSILVRHV
jgi:hypothetical protein